MKEQIKKLIEQDKEFVIACYKHLHAKPELSFEEYETSAFVQNQLKQMNIPFKSGIAGTGILARIEGRNPDKRTVALRADMDALPVCEEVSVGWKSTREGVMHACGHDAHTACLLGVACVLNKIRDSFEGTVLLIFQPGEEKAPGGARLMLEDGLFDGYTPDIVLAQHVSVDYPTGTLAFLPGMIMASADEIHVKINGTGGHGALPHLCNDTVLAGAQTLVALQQVKSRLCHPLTPMVLTFGRFVAGGAQNIIPHQVLMSGTFRTVDEKWRATAKEHIQRIIRDTCAAYGCGAEIEIPDGYPSVTNDAEITRKSVRFASEWVGEENIRQLEMRMTGEDFAFFTQLYPSMFFRFGIRGRSNENSGGLHSSTFCIDLDALEYGVGGMAWIAWNFLNE